MSPHEIVNDHLRRRRRRRMVLHNETYAAVALALTTVIALVWANVGHSYHDFWETPASLNVGPLSLELTLHGWVDEGLMAIFFFMVGLDVRRDLTLGDLHLPGRALLPAATAVGGLVVPVGLFLLVTGSGPGAQAWGTVISTDTAFALGMLALIGPKRAPRLRLFLLAFAVIDDIGALLVIAVFYTDSLNLVALAFAGAGLVGVWCLQRAGVWRILPYLALGIVTWYAVYLSGVHATIAGVLIALLMPVYNLRSRDLEGANEIFRLFRQAPAPGTAMAVREALAYSMPLNQRLSFALPPYVNYLVVPLFALANAGVELNGAALATAVSSPLTWGVIVGLVLGKFIGAILGAGIVMRLVPSSHLPGLDLPRVAGIGALSGMGFTISLLVAGLALSDEALRDQARIGVLSASLLALALAAVIFRIGDRLWPLPPPEDESLRRPIDDHTDHIVGDVNAPVTLINYADMTFEGRWRLMEALKGMRPMIEDGRVRVVLRHMAYTPEAINAALALEAAYLQDKIWPMHDALAELRGDVDDHTISQAAESVGLDVDSLWSRITSGADEAKVTDDGLDVEGLQEDGSPVVYINGRRLHGLLHRWTLTEAANEALAEVKS
ncbi:Na+/H+ antiporter NhaA [Actinomyces slackii]|uniref:Na(+)/H(+) antiporter NhaA n=1 Tax=Actinomyces slackii TaxID=52774 RepID=A0A3S4TCK5_9ACTO|nr:Na+/H+ antiporter NhaA [Actinomyces slackii]VEG74755.1 Sodium/proton antiporter nhaA [Actinomyces slackii]